MRMHAYYFGFDATGVPEIDTLLSAVASAGKSYHHTESWTDEAIPWEEAHRGETPAAWIQNAANDAAAAVRRLRCDAHEDCRANEALARACAGQQPGNGQQQEKKR